MVLRELLKNDSVVAVTGDPDVEIRSVVADSRRVQPGDVFVAVRGTVMDGHDKIDQAIGNGAVAIVGDRQLSELSASPSVYVQLDDSRTGHAHLLRASRPDIRQALAEITFIGVTGTNGKTTVATLIEQGLIRLKVDAGFIGTTGYRYGGDEIPATHTTPDVDRLYTLIVEMHRAGVTTVVMEVSSHALTQHRVDGVPFSIALFTNLSRDHLDYHETMEKYAEAKSRLFTDLSPQSVALINGGEFADTMMRSSSAQHTVEVNVEESECRPDGSSFTLDGNSFATPLIGTFNVSNAALAASTLLALGFDIDQAKDAVATAVGPVGRMQRVDLNNGATAIVDYAHTPDALEKALRALRQLVPDRARLHVVFGCGGDRDHGKRAPMGAIAAELADEVWVTSDNPRNESPLDIIAEIQEGIGEMDDRIHVIEDRGLAITSAVKDARAGDMVLIAGKGHEIVQIVGDERLPFSDVHVVHEALASTSASGFDVAG